MEAKELTGLITDYLNTFSNEVCTMLHKFMTEQGIQSNLPCI